MFLKRWQKSLILLKSEREFSALFCDEVQWLYLPPLPKPYRGVFFGVGALFQVFTCFLPPCLFYFELYYCSKWTPPKKIHLDVFILPSLLMEAMKHAMAVLFFLLNIVPSSGMVSHDCFHWLQIFSLTSEHTAFITAFTHIFPNCLSKHLTFCVFVVHIPMWLHNERSYQPIISLNKHV